MADDFDDLFRSSHSNASHAGPSTPGWGTYGEDDLTTSNPFADLQSSRLYDSHIEQPLHANTAQSPSIHDDFASKASLSRRSTASSQASTSVTQPVAEQDTRQQRSNSTSESSTSTESGAAPITGPPSSSEDAHEGGDRVLVSPFVTPDSNSEETDPMAASEATVGDADDEAVAGVKSQQRNLQDSYWSSASVYEPSHEHGFGEGFGGGSSSHADFNTHDVASSSSSSMAGQHYDDSHANNGFADEVEHEDEPISESRPSREAEDAASIRTVGLESDTASMRSHRVRIRIKSGQFS